MKIIGLLSGKGGVGKTTSAINIAAAMNSLGQNVVVVDGNLTTPNVGLHLGTPVVPVSFHHVLKGKFSINEALYRHHSDLLFVPGSLSINDLEDLKLSRLKLIKNLQTDYVILDGAAGLGGETIKVIDLSDELLIVTNAELPAVTDALKTVKLVEELGKEVKGIIVTRLKNDDLDISVRNIEAMIEKPVIAVVPEDENMRKALARKDALIHTHPQTKAAKSYLRFAASLAGIPLPKPKQPTWLQRLRSYFV